MTRRAGPAGRPLPGQGEAPLPGRQEASGLLGLGAVRPGAWGLAGWGADGRPRAARLHRDESPLPSHRGPGRRWAQRSGCRAGVGAGEVGGSGGHGAQPGAAVGGGGQGSRTAQCSRETGARPRAWPSPRHLVPTHHHQNPEVGVEVAGLGGFQLEEVHADDGEHDHEEPLGGRGGQRCGGLGCIVGVPGALTVVTRPSRMRAPGRWGPRADDVGGLGPRHTLTLEGFFLLKLVVWFQSPRGVLFVCPKRPGWIGAGASEDLARQPLPQPPPPAQGAAAPSARAEDLLPGEGPTLVGAPERLRQRPPALHLPRGPRANGGTAPHARASGLR